MIQSPYSGPICKGAYLLGTACGMCEKCLDELADFGRLVTSKVGERQQQQQQCIERVVNMKAVEAEAAARRERRERIATAALQGILSNPEGIDASAIGNAPPLPLLQQYVSELARGYADALIAELDRKGEAG